MDLVTLDVPIKTRMGKQSPTVQIPIPVDWALKTGVVHNNVFWFREGDVYKGICTFSYSKFDEDLYTCLPFVSVDMSFNMIKGLLNLTEDLPNNDKKI